MRKLFKAMAATAIAAVTVVTCAALAACSGDGEDDTAKDATYTVTFDNIETWDYSFVNINAFGDTAGVGMINLNSWGNKKLALGSDGTCDGTGCSWTCQLYIDGESAYTLSLIAHLVGDNTNYAGECDFTYAFQGTYTAGTDSYVLAAPTYAKVSIEQTGTTTWGCIISEYDFANYIPDAGWSLDSNSVKTTPTSGNGYVTDTSKVVAEYLTTTVFGGATFNVSGTSITSVTNITYPSTNV